MVAPLNMNDNRITGLTNNVLYLTKVAINSMLTMRLQKEILVILQKSISWMMLINGLQNGLQNGVVWFNVTKIDDLDISPHYWNKECLFVSPIKRLGFYM